MTQEEQLIELIKNKLPQLLREDEEFRAFMLGTLIQYLPTREEFKLILQRLERLEEHLERLEAEMVELRKEQIALREDFMAMQKTIEAMQKTIEAMQKTIEAMQKTIEAMQKSIEAMIGRIEGVETKQTTLVSRFDSLEREMRTGFSRFGILVEDVLRNALRTAVENWLGAGRVERMELGGREVDVVIRDAEHVLLEVTARAHLQDIAKLKASAEDYERRFNIKPRLAIACAYAAPTVVQSLSQEGIEIISAEVPE
jgi:hypothetical protein